MKAKTVLTCGPNTATIQVDPSGEGYLVEFKFADANWVMRAVSREKAILYAQDILERNTFVVD